MPVIYIFNGMIMNVTTNESNALVTVTYRDVSSNTMLEETVVLATDPNTVILNENGNETSATTLQAGMLINAIISSAMTRSNPPQAYAYFIIITNEYMQQPSEQPGMSTMPSSRPMPPNRPMPPSRPMPPNRPRPVTDDVTTGNIINVDRNNRSFTTISNLDISTIVQFNVPEDTPIYNRIGRQVNFSMLAPGMRVRVRHASFMTASIPPQTTAFEIQIL
jgi:hypothetical protein